MKVTIATFGTNEKFTPDQTDEIECLSALFMSELKDMHKAEKSYCLLMPGIAQQACNDGLVEMLPGHFELMVEHVTRLEDIFAKTGEIPTEDMCQTMSGLVAEAERTISATKRGRVRDVAIIGAIQKIEYYKIATYSTLYTYAKTLGERKIAAMLHMTLNEARETEIVLLDIARPMQNDLTQIRCGSLQPHRTA